MFLLEHHDVLFLSTIKGSASSNAIHLLQRPKQHKSLLAHLVQSGIMPLGVSLQSIKNVFDTLLVLFFGPEVAECACEIAVDIFDLGAAFFLG